MDPTKFGRTSLSLAVAGAAAVMGLSGAARAESDECYTYGIASTNGNTSIGNDAHFHPTNYIGQGTTLRNFLDGYMGNDKNWNNNPIPRSVVMAIPLQQKWDYHENLPYPPTYYIGLIENGKNVAANGSTKATTPFDAELYYYSLSDAMLAREFQKLKYCEQWRIDPMITSFNPMDMYGVQHIRRMLLMYPGVFSGIGEFTVHKEVVSNKLAGESIAAINNLPELTRKDPDVVATASGGAPASKVTLYSQALRNVFDFAAESGLIATLHNDIYRYTVSSDGKKIEFDNDGTYEYVAGLKKICANSPNATVIWAHTGLGRYVVPKSNHLAMVADVLNSCPKWNVDISWDYVRKAIANTPDPGYSAAGWPTIQDWKQFLNTYQDRVLFGSDKVLFARQGWDQASGTVVPNSNVLQTRASYLGEKVAYVTLLKTTMAMPSTVVDKIMWKNYERLFGAAKTKVRAWEAAHVNDDIWNLPVPKTYPIVNNN